ncbi:MAG: hypothetical protein HC858_11865 [Brachymonas sp.]|nr:hypothetical protein [Brachymonas sp.]
MSGTSMDGVDAALVDFSKAKPRVAGIESAPIAIDLRATLMRLNSSGDDELHTAQLATNALMRLYANAVKTLLAKAGLKPEDIRAIYLSDLSDESSEPIIEQLTLDQVL